MDLNLMTKDLKFLHWSEACSIEYLKERLNYYYHNNTHMSSGYPRCLTANGSRKDGYAQIKLSKSFGRGLRKTWSPRPWQVESFVRGIEVPPECEHSHLCGKGKQGCVDFNHICIESHEANLDRDRCHEMTGCPGCSLYHPVRVCTHIPRCIQDNKANTTQ